MATLLAWWKLDEASSGVAPTTCADDSGNANTLTMNYGSGGGAGTAVWTSITEGSGIDFTATANTASSAVASLANIAANGNLGASLDAATAASIVIGCDIDSGAGSAAARVLMIGQSASAIDVGVSVGLTGSVFRWGTQEVSYPSFNAAAVVHAVFDTTEAVAADRIRVYFDGSLQTATSGTLTQNANLASVNSSDRYVALGNRPGQGDPINGRIFCAGILLGPLTSGEIAASYSSILADNDANPFAGGGGGSNANLLAGKLGGLLVGKL